jgi:hypothetical protein
MRYLILGSLIVFSFSCSSLLKYRGNRDQFKNAEFEQKVTILEADEVKEEKPKPETVTDLQTNAVASGTTDVKVSATTVVTPKPKTTKNSTKTKNTKTNVKPEANIVVPVGRQPDIEDSEGFDNKRRPLVDPFRVGELVEHEVSYLGATAGTIQFKVRPYAVVNGRKSYNFFIDLKSNSFFSRVYAVDDQVQTYVDYETLVPHVFKLNIRDSGQVKEAQSYFDNVNLKADYWEHRYTEKHGHEEKKTNWSILPYSQNPFSAVFYMRVFKWVVGKEYVFRVADDEKNVTFKAKALEKTVLNTEAGKFNAIKLKAEVHSRGNLAKATDFYMWISDDDRKYILRIEVKLPIGSLVSEAVDIEEGKL